ncbi:hypothetical protein A8H39_10980 [Paraburkholderia fungorum]|uniref:hypothetical protein n=1 Tax=Paraburkholderia fungorum TaxID=134537 RepID=UPI00048A2295|nr:hypothetical protein [Paraburkholderia fungorum]MBB5543314.1 hypothetical protein [Paraburkholderia fungorum]PNE56325.1 hypothetical protein A8H39_10980 [Paraburkholderia fungorum]
MAAKKNASAKMPSMQFYPADWRKDPGVQALGFHDRGVWFEILCLMHESSERGVLMLNGVPMPLQALANILGLDSQTLNQTVTNLTTYGVAKVRNGDGALYSKRMVADESLCKVRREAGKKGGNPNLLNQKANQTATPSSSSSSSTTVSKPLSSVEQAGENDAAASTDDAALQAVGEGESSNGAQGSLLPAEPTAAGKVTATKPKQTDADFETAWGFYPKRDGGSNKQAAMKAWRARIVQGKGADAMIAGVVRYAKYCDAKGNTGSQYVKRAETFLGPDLHFELEWAITAQTSAPARAEKFDPLAYVSQTNANSPTERGNEKHSDCIDVQFNEVDR